MSFQWLRRHESTLVYYGERLVQVALLAAILGGSAVRVREAFLHSPLDHIFSDPQRHWDHGRDALNTSPMVLIDPPIYQMWVSLVQKWSLGEPRLIAGYAALISIATPACWYLFLRELLRSATLALAGWAILAWMPSWIGIFSYFMSETLLLPLMGISLWQTMRAKRLGSVSSFSGMVALWTLTGLTRAIALPLAGIAGFYVWAGHRQKLSTALWSALIAGAMMGPFALRNYHQMNLWSPMGTGYLNGIYVASGKKNIELDISRDGARWGYVFGSPSLYAPQLAPYSDWAPKREGTVKVSINLRNGPKDWEAELKRTAVHGATLRRLRWENLILVMFGDSWPDNNPAYRIHEVATQSRWIWAPLFVIVLLASAICYRSARRQPLILGLVATWFVFQGLLLVAINEGRYRKPLEGLLVVQALVLVEYLATRGDDRSRARSHRPQGAPVP